MQPSDDGQSAAEQIAALVESAPAIDGVPLSPAAAPDDTAEAPDTVSPAGSLSVGGGARLWGYDPEEINRDYALVLWGGRAVVVKTRPDGPIEDRVRVLSIEAFEHWFSNKFTEVVGRDGKVRAVNWGRAWRTDHRRRHFEGIEFFPNPDGEPSTPGYLNLWRGFDVSPDPSGSCAIFRDHLLNNVCQGNTELFSYVFAWFAQIMQRPRERIGTALVLRGRMGSGKTKVGEVVGSLIPSHFFQVDDPRYIVGQFNVHMSNCLLLQAEEAVWAGDKHAEGRLKGLVTSEVK